jgi:hypothetical protein
MRRVSQGHPVGPSRRTHPAERCKHEADLVEDLARHVPNGPPYGPQARGVMTRDEMSGSDPRRLSPSDHPNHEGCRLIMQRVNLSRKFTLFSALSNP